MGEALGTPPSWNTTAKDRPRIIQDPSLHFWSVMRDAFSPTLIHPESKMEPNDEDDGISIGPPPLSPRPPWEEDSSDDESESEFDYPSSEHLELPPKMDAPFKWGATDLQEGGEWFEERLDKLRTITEGWHEQRLVMLDARRLLASHRLNYTYQGAQRLEILWWECPPPEQWESLRFGGSMKFMETPVPILEENGKMTESQLAIDVAFVTKLISLGVLALVPHGVLLMNVSPLFLVAKPGQPYQWRCIADMTNGHQNKSCA
jgi:hypothetical protein